MMLRHIVFFTAKQPEDLPVMQAGLDLLKTIPINGKLEILRHTRKDPVSSPVDLVVYGEFADEAALAAYKAHPAYQHSIAIVRPLRDLRIAADVDAD